MTSAELKADMDRMAKRSESIKAPDFVDADKARSQWTQFKNGVLKSKHGSSYRAVYRIVTESKSMSGQLSEIF